MFFERRRHFRQPADIAARVRLAGPPPSAEVRACATDLSTSGAMLSFEALPGWGLDLSAPRMLVRLELDLPGRGIFRCEAQLRRIVIDDEGCRLGVQFTKIDGDCASWLRRHLDETLAREENAAVRRQKRSHSRRRRLQTAMIVGLFAFAAVGLTSSMLGLIEAFPGWMGKIRGAIRSELRDAADRAVENEARRMRQAPRDPDGGRDDSAEPGSPRDPGAPDDSSDGRGLTPEEKERIKRFLRENPERSGG